MIAVLLTTYHPDRYLSSWFLKLISYVIEGGVDLGDIEIKISRNTKGLGCVERVLKAVGCKYTVIDCGSGLQLHNLELMLGTSLFIKSIEYNMAPHLDSLCKSYRCVVRNMDSSELPLSNSEMLELIAFITSKSAD